MPVSGSEPNVSRVPAHGRYVLGLLTLVYVVNMADRTLLSILLEPIKLELGVSDTAMGFLSGFAFAVFYTTAGIPIARLADRASRRNIIAVGLVAWSLLTAASGLARSFASLALLRVGVGIGEAAASPSSHSLIADFFPPAKRATAMAIYVMGASLGITLGMSLGGWLSDTVGWRAAFAIVGLPGVALALIVRFTIREPTRGMADAESADDRDYGIGEVFRFLWGSKAFRHLAFATSMYGLGTYGAQIWAPTFLIRVHGMTRTEVGAQLGMAIGLAAMVGGFLWAVLADRLGRRDIRWQMWLPALGGLAATPFLVSFLLWPSSGWAVLFYVPSALLHAAYTGPSYALAQGLAKLRMRALASAAMLFVVNLIGLGLGPQLIGILNDLMAPRLGDEAVRYSLLIVGVTSNLWAATHSVLGARCLERDLARAARSDDAGH